MKKYLKYLDLGMAALALVALIMLFVPAINWGESTANGLKVVFGHSESTKAVVATITVTYFKFSFMNLLTYLLTIGAIACAVLAYLKKNALFTLISAGLSLVGGVFFLLTKHFCVLGQFFLDLYKLADTTFATDPSVTLAAGPIIAAVCLFLACAAGVAKKLLDK